MSEPREDEYSRPPTGPGDEIRPAPKRKRQPRGSIVVELEHIAKRLEKLRARTAKGGEEMARTAKGISDAARGVCQAAAGIASIADIAEGIEPRHAGGLLKRVRKALGYTYP